MKRIIVAVTGASGAPYARRLVDCLITSGAEVHLVISPLGRRLFVDELAIEDINASTLLGRVDERLVLHPYKDVGDPLGSGSTPIDAMVICPCSGNTLAQVAAGMGDNLITRAAQVTLKERRRLVIVHREMPMNHLDLENCLRLSTAGAVICPAAPGFYMLPRRIEDLVDFVVGKIMDLVGVKHKLNTRWTDMLDASAPAAEDHS
ncbi:MAG: UbiX family flavin prenyltransferase [Phycisphaerales bacterium]|nr:UbiX family flavin prenyltransferase [Phycisphaerales bacterium]